jgi:hypothetical protein
MGNPCLIWLQGQLPGLRTLAGEAIILDQNVGSSRAGVTERPTWLSKFRSGLALKPPQNPSLRIRILP